MAIRSRSASRIDRSEGLEIRVADVAKRFGANAALEDINLTVRPGELLALLGPSGSGKTTLLRVIAGLEEANQGHVYFGGQDATSLPVQKRQVGFVFQHYALFRHMNVADNIAYGLRARERARRPAESEIRDRVGKLLDLVQLPGLEKRFPAQLSGGQRQRIALARALAVEPRVLLLDEPFGALDAKVRKDLRGWLREIHERTGQTTIFVTHDQDEALELADRVAIMSQGRLEQVGTIDEVQDRPATPFVMNFLGDAVRFDATVADGRILVAGRPLGFRPPQGLSGAVDLYCRPWHLHLVPSEQEDASGTITAIRRLAGARRVEVSGAAAETLEIDVPLDAPLQPGETVHLGIKQGFLFPR
ncbi:sulfate/molybdate ABC transporter ATP-binding protein [Microvirga pudoricolor]|uniref:sulfate/molybdate ABC transporter ATP-binding protein n=1 Tax=Microvirga pudoricolor TaxID=2778729 RepID=UPI001951767F|nr:sulfate/molybdate ABC transporter ATP-binding protein [Microvirga pudoricolor]MBM6595207.1 sulfate/molybdate ABC transporter ATP-binding protein [Microvirga pudoricolor]